MVGTEFEGVSDTGCPVPVSNTSELEQQSDETKKYELPWMKISFQLAAIVYETDQAFFQEYQIKDQKMSDSRQLGMYLANVVCQKSYREIANYTARSRSSVRHGVAQVEDRREAEEFDRLVTKLEGVLTVLQSPDIHCLLNSKIEVSFSIDGSGPAIDRTV